MKPNKEIIINDILIELEKGINYTDCFSVMFAKFRFSDRTFDKYWIQANEQYRINQQAIQKELLAASVEFQKERLKLAILTKEEILEKLTEIAEEAFSYSKDGVNKDYVNRINAMKVINDMLGFKAPAQIEMKTEIKPLEFYEITAKK